MTLDSSASVSRPQRESPRGLDGWTVWLVLLLLALAVFLALPFDRLGVASWVLTFQAHLHTALYAAGPFGVVALLGAIVGLAEIAATFPSYPREALGTRWAQNLVLVNALAAAFAFWIVRTYAPSADLILTVVGVGIGFQAIIRTRFTIAKQIGGAGGSDISLNMGWLYDQFQNLCKTQIDMELMRGRRTAVTRLLERFPTLAQLYDIAQYTIVSRATLAPEEEKVRLQELDTLFNPKAPANFARTSMALMILEQGGQAYVDLLLSQPEPAAPPTVSPETIVKRLVEKYTLPELVALATRLLPAPAEQAWVQDAAKPAAGVTEASQKATIAHFLIARLGTDAVLREIGSS